MLIPQRFAKQPGASLLRNHGDLIAFLVIVGKAAGPEKLPEPVVAQFDFRAEPDIAGQQADDRRLREGFQFQNLPSDTRADFTARLRQDVSQPMRVTIEEKLE